MIITSAASPATLDRYARGTQELVCLLPHGWGVIALADETLRSEHWEIVREDLVSADAVAFQALTSPWSYIIGQTAWGASGSRSRWWYLHVLGPVAKPEGCLRAARQSPTAFNRLDPLQRRCLSPWRRPKRRPPRPTLRQQQQRVP